MMVRKAPRPIAPSTPQISNTRFANHAPPALPAPNTIQSNHTTQAPQSKYVPITFKLLQYTLYRFLIF